MELRALVAVILSMAVLAAYQYFFVPPPPEQPVDAVPGASTPEAGAPTQTLPGETPALAVTDEEADANLPLVAASENTQTTIITGDYRIIATNVGGRLESVVLPAYRDDQGDDLDLVGGPARAAGRLPLEWISPGNPDLTATLNSALFQVSVEGGTMAGGARRATAESPVTLRYEWADGAGRSARKELTFFASGSQTNLRASATGFGSPLYVGLGAGLDEVEVGLRNAYLAERALAYSAAGLDKWSADDLEPAVVMDAPLWAGVESHYFLGALLLNGDNPAIPRAIFTPAAVVIPPLAEGEEPTPHLLPSIAVDVAALERPAILYYGPKKYDYLGDLNVSLQEAVDFGLWGFISKPLLFVLNSIYSVVGNYGWAIVLLTAMLRLVFWPLNQKAMTSMRKTQKLQPQMAAIRSKYKGAKDLDSRQKMNEEVMALYKREGVSPLGGCLPMLAQIPILFSFYALLSVAIELRQAPFLLWVQDLSRHDPLLVLPLLMGASMFVQQRLTPTNAADPQQASMMRMMRLMPILFTVMFLYVPSGLVLYWLVNNVLGIGQQLYINRSMDRQLEAEKAAKKGKKSQRGKQ
jgi:YidC/Oxa1 family membrane protein insertase